MPHGDYSEERLEKIQQIMYDIRKTEYEINSQKIIIIGDFNEMPYDKGCLNANGFHGLPVLSVKDKSTRKVNNIEYRKFYNPMWNLMGDFTYPPGTYFYNQSKLHSPMWYILEQKIMSKDVLSLFVKESLKIITSCGGIDFAELGAYGAENNKFEVFLTVKRLEHYRNRMMFVEYGSVAYPATVVMNDSLAVEYSDKRDFVFRVNFMKDLDDMLNTIINSQTLVALLQNLIYVQRFLYRILWNVNFMI